VRCGLGAVVMNCCKMRLLHPSKGLEAGVERRFIGYRVDLQLRVRLARNLALRSNPQGGHTHGGPVLQAMQCFFPKILIQSR
jgi:hypothetical protein